MPFSQIFESELLGIRKLIIYMLLSRNSTPKSREYSPSSEASIRSVSHESRDSLQCSQQLACSIPSQSTQYQVFPTVSAPQICGPYFCMHYPPVPCMHLIVLGLMPLTEDYKVRISWDFLLSYFERDQMQPISENSSKMKCACYWCHFSLRWCRRFKEILIWN